MSIQLAGEQNGKGFYLYDEKRKARPTPEIKDFVKESQAESGIMPNGKVGILLSSRLLHCILVDRSNYTIKI